MKEQHECIHKEYDVRVGCLSSSIDKRLILTLHYPYIDINKTDIDNFVCHVKFCPFCGYEEGK